MNNESENTNNSTLFIAEVGGCAYFVILNGKYVVVHASTMERALEWLSRAGYQWEKVENIKPTNIY